MCNRCTDSMTLRSIVSNCDECKDYFNDDSIKLCDNCAGSWNGDLE